MDEGRIADAYVAGDVDIDGDVLAPYALRRAMKDFHPEAGRDLGTLAIGTPKASLANVGVPPRHERLIKLAPQ